ncbi:rab11 family-interacting protein 1 isoform X1 [Synchiropus splendidus]|uniref:rab11 family-interacting protein 1 isoform X1 n=1 Tax=Synchiropus splendidus TaxID=270530 RepID=UPI00237E6858|nr:rab11 family-interacting protein 1 isoform X1 [Synchiropus splendidus]
MSLADQSQQWFPTSVQVTVHQARGLRAKGKSGTNDAYAIIQVAKDKFSTSVAEKSVAPVWKEEAAFDLPLFHPGNAERCTLYIIVMHRAQVGLDKFLGQAVVNLLELHDNKSRKKTDWHKLVDKTGKEDKVRGEVLLDITFMRNNMSASMMDLSMEDKPRSRISKLKDKVRGKKKDGFSDSASAIVPSVSQVLTDSEGEFDSVSLNQGPEGKKKSKLKKLFAPKSNLQKNVSQSMSTLGTLPEKNSFLSGSRSSGLNVDSPEGKKKFKFLGHKRTGSSDSKVSQGPFSLLGRSKHSNSDLNNLCINGSHVYDEGETKSGSTPSLNSSGQGSVEDISKHASEASNRVTVPSFRLETAEAQAQQRHRVEEEEKKQAEERRLAEAKRQEEEERYRAEVKRQQQEEEEKRRQEEEKRKSFLEEEAKLKRQKEEEARLEEERRKQEEQKKQEEASMSERLSSLFGMIKKKEEKKEEVQQGTKEESPTPTPEQQPSNNPFEEIPLGPDPSLSNADPRQPSNRTQQTPSAMVFLNRTAKVSAVKPRLTQTSDSTDPQISSEQCPSPDASDSTFSSVPAESPENFSSLHLSLAPTELSDRPPGVPQDGVENLSPTMADMKRRAPQPPLYPAKESQAPVRQINNPAYVEPGGSQQGKKLSILLPDYETLFPQKRHGVQGQTRWDHIVAEVSQKHRDTPELLGPEMSVDGPSEFPPTQRSSVSMDRSPVRQSEPSRPTSTKKVAAPAPPKPRSAMDSVQRQSQGDSQYYPTEVPEQRPSPVSSRRGHSVESLSVERPRRESAPSKPTRQLDNPPAVIQRKTSDLEAPKARPRQRVSGRDLVEQEYPAARLSDESIHNPLHTTSSVSDLKPDPFPATELLSNDLFASKGSQKPKDKGMSPDDLDKIFSQEKTADPFSAPNSVRSTNKKNARETEVYSKQSSYAFIRNNSLRQKQIAMSDKASKTATEEPAATLQTIDLNEPPTSKVEEQMPSHIGGDPFSSDQIPSSDLRQEVLDETASQGGILSVGKSPLRAWVSPSEAQPISTQNSGGGGVGVMSRRPHPVKPMESPYPNTALKEIKVQDASLSKFKMSDSVGTGPYTQLTQEELITLVVKQQADLSRKDAKITELEEYIDNLLVRVIEEQPSILQSLTTKPV